MSHPVLHCDSISITCVKLLTNVNNLSRFECVCRTPDTLSLVDTLWMKYWPLIPRAFASELIKWIPNKTGNNPLTSDILKCHCGWKVSGVPSSLLLLNHELYWTPSEKDSEIWTMWQGRASNFSTRWSCLVVTVQEKQK